MRHMLTDDLWTALRPLVGQAEGHRRGPKPTVPDRDFFDALVYLARTGVPWRDLPGDFGRWDAIDARFRRWVASGGLRRLFERMTADPRFGATRRVLIDSTIIRAHRHAAGARRTEKRSGPGGRRRPKGSAGAAAGSRLRPS